MVGGRAVDGAPPVELALEGLPTTWRTSQARWMSWVWGVYAVAALVQLLLVLGGGEVDLWRLLLYPSQLVLGVLGVVVGARSAVRLEATGYRVARTRRGGRLRPWSDVAEIRPPGRWAHHAEIRGTHASGVPVALVGMTGDQAVELQRRLVEAQLAARAGGTS